MKQFYFTVTSSNNDNALPALHVVWSVAVTEDDALYIHLLA